ncbi:hypothetical protein JL2886_00238 [Phaeobacter gallaeciensis]|uniref:Uncharacterized protein n=1 Tax=Phaeobacter gallaeciensis TaxID=60890 RepID=A0A1B0ZLZ5_9RHOB|nr:hypothetical protein JL2886_00238 [Phaeobacter gallaeciensis]
MKWGATQVAPFFVSAGSGQGCALGLNLPETLTKPEKGSRIWRR